MVWQNLTLLVVWLCVCIKVLAKLQKCVFFGSLLSAVWFFHTSFQLITWLNGSLFFRPKQQKSIPYCTPAGRPNTIFQRKLVELLYSVLDQKFGTKLCVSSHILSFYWLSYFKQLETLPSRFVICHTIYNQFRHFFRLSSDVIVICKQWSWSVHIN